MAMLLVLHLMICVVLVGAVLMQRSEGGALGMGGGGGGNLISGRGAADMMVNITSWAGGAFFVTSMLLAFMAGTRPADRSVIPENGSAKPGFHLSIPGFPSAPATKVAPAPAPLGTAPLAASPGIAAPAAPVGAMAPAPAEPVTRAGPLETTAAPKQPLVAVTKTGATPNITAPRATTPVGAAPAPAATAPKAATPAPMIPLPAAAPPAAPATESAQPPVPAPAEKQKTGPDQ